LASALVCKKIVANFLQVENVHGKENVANFLQKSSTTGPPRVSGARLSCDRATTGACNSLARTFIFTGHTAIAMLAATEVACLGRRWLTVLAVSIVGFEVATVLVLRAHYTMDVFTGMVTGLLAAHLAGRLTAIGNSRP
jgi:hypothetical protein